MTEVQKWREYHRLCDAWTAKHGYGDEKAFHAYVRKITKQLGI